MRKTRVVQALHAGPHMHARTAAKSNIATHLREENLEEGILTLWTLASCEWAMTAAKIQPCFVVVILSLVFYFWSTYSLSASSKRRHSLTTGHGVFWKTCPAAGHRGTVLKIVQISSSAHPPGQQRGIVCPGGGAFAILLHPGPWAFVYPGPIWHTCFSKFIGRDQAFGEDCLVRQGLDKLVDVFKSRFSQF